MTDQQDTPPGSADANDIARQASAALVSTIRSYIEGGDSSGGYLPAMANSIEAGVGTHVDSWIAIEAIAHCIAASTPTKEG